LFPDILWETGLKPTVKQGVNGINAPKEEKHTVAQRRHLSVRNISNPR